MSNTYKITFKPVEPYFFGNEKNFVFPGQDQKSIYSSSYFIRSEKVPSQSTVLGALRYVFLPYKWQDFKPDDTKEVKDQKREDNNQAVGKSSFDIEFDGVQDFGIIKKISPVFICGVNDDGQNITLIPGPMDHNIADEKEQEEAKKKEQKEAQEKDEKKKRFKYSPFNEYIGKETTEGSKLYAVDFDVKKGLSHGWVALETAELYSQADLFESDLRIGINRKHQKDGFFKKEYCMLRKGFAFAVYAELEKDAVPKTECVFLGQGKSAFTLTFEKVDKNDLKENCEAFLNQYTRFGDADYQLVYCLGDCFVSDFDNCNVSFCAIDTKDYRAFKTVGIGQVKKEGTLYRLLKAGSIIVSKDANGWTVKNKKENANNIGFNNFVVSGGK